MRQKDCFLNQARLRETLIMLLDHAMPACTQAEYRLVGTGAALLRGVQLPVGDIDILVKERKDVDAFGSALSTFKCLLPPTWLPGGNQYYANYEINGVEAQISTVEVTTDKDTIEAFEPGPWEHFSLIPCGPYTIPTVALELRLITELRRNRPDRYNPIIGYMQANGCDIDFVRRGMDNTGKLTSDFRAHVLNQLKGM